MTSLAAETVGRRLGGERPSRIRAFATAAVAAVGVGVIVYKLLRSGEGED